MYRVLIQIELKAMTEDEKEGLFHPDVAYLLTPEISDILAKGLTELYEKRPRNPVEYLAAWLLNKSNETLLKLEVTS